MLIQILPQLFVATLLTSKHQPLLVHSANLSFLVLPLPCYFSVLSCPLTLCVHSRISIIWAVACFIIWPFNSASSTFAQAINWLLFGLLNRSWVTPQTLAEMSTKLAPRLYLCASLACRKRFSTTEMPPHVANNYARQYNSTATPLAISKVLDKLLMSKPVCKSKQLLCRYWQEPPPSQPLYEPLYPCISKFFPFGDCLQCPLHIIYYVIVFLCCFAMLTQQEASQKVELYCNV